MNYDLKEYIHSVQDFPSNGILFRDIQPAIENPGVFSYVVDSFLKMFDLKNVDAFVGIESRGFIFASALAARSMRGFIPLRKAGKLPQPTIKKSYKLEYGSAELEMKPGHRRIVLIDDVLATGGTLSASLDICAAAGYQVLDVGVLIHLKYLSSSQVGGKSVKSLVQYE